MSGEPNMYKEGEVNVFDKGIKVTIEITDFDTLALLVEFLAKHGFKVKSKDDQTLVKPVQP